MSCEQVGAYVDGELDAREAAEYRQHLAGCAACQAELRELLLMRAVEDTHGEALREPVRGAASDGSATTSGAPADSARVAPAGRGDTLSLGWYRRRRVLAAAVTATVALAAGLAFLLRPEEPVQLALAATRPVEARVAYAGADRYRPYEVLRGGDPIREPVPASALATLERRGDLRGLAAGYLLAGDVQRAREVLDRAGEDADLDAERAAAALLEGRPADALRFADSALARVPHHPAATWNRALALRDLHRNAEAAAAFDGLAAAGEPGWSVEAGRRAAALRAP